MDIDLTDVAQFFSTRGCTTLGSILRKRKIMSCTIIDEEIGFNSVKNDSTHMKLLHRAQLLHLTHNKRAYIERDSVLHISYGISTRHQLLPHAAGVTSTSSHAQLVIISSCKCDPQFAGAGSLTIPSATTTAAPPQQRSKLNENH